MPLTALLFRGLRPSDRAAVEAAFERTEFLPGERVLREGDAVAGGSRLFVLGTGVVDVLVEGATEPVGAFGPGEVFGDVAVLFGTFRSATVVARTACVAWGASRDRVVDLMPLLPFAGDLCFLRTLDVLRGVQDHDLQELASWAVGRHLERGQVVVKEGDAGGSMFAVRGGELEVVRDGAGVARLTKGETFGLWSLLTGHPRSATVVAKGDCTVLEIGGRAAERLKGPLFSYTMSREAVLAVHHGTPLLRGLGPEERSRALDGLEVRSFAAGELIVARGEAPRTAFVVRDGSVDLPDGSHAGFAYFGCCGGLGAQRDVRAVTDGTEVVVVNGGGAGPDLAVHRVPIGDLVWIRNIGRGAFATVSLVRMAADGPEGPLFALKTPRRATVTARKAVRHELNVMTLVDSPFCIALVGEVVGDGVSPPSILLEYAPNGTLLELLTRSRRLSEHQARFYVGCLVLGLEALHDRGIVFRDLKPDNVLLDSARYAKLADFGFAKRTNGDRAFSVCGTEHYTAPEIMAHEGSTLGVDHWSLGIVLYELVTGTTPFEVPGGTMYHVYRRGASGRFNVPDYVSEPCEALIRGLLRPDPAARLGARGCGEIMSHPWFDGLDWAGLRGRALAAPREEGPPDSFS